ncbi:MAG: phenylalanine--tRNA ligase beta subunit-related protein [Planctomycetes bacterium]|jgi:lysyl-tRNA synthetase class 2|nr:phenylalanine--tRNA ligase beta subunit-related protein [Planctomycetota bacterium]
MRKIIVDQTIFAKFPDFKRGIIIVENIDNQPENAAISALLGAEIKKRAVETRLEHEYIKAWDEAHRQFGSNPNKFPPSIKSLLKRIGKGGELPFINCAVALFNFISIKYLLPCGGDDTAAISGNLRLGLAQGDELFMALGSREPEHPAAGEVIYFDDGSKNVMCRRWNWRNGDFSKITAQTKNAVINIDGIGPANEPEILSARDELAELLKENCAAKINKDLLSHNHQEIEITI